jgi:hypothetical protein
MQPIKQVNAGGFTADGVLVFRNPGGTEALPDGTEVSDTKFTVGFPYEASDGNIGAGHDLTETQAVYTTMRVEQEIQKVLAEDPGSSVEVVTSGFSRGGVSSSIFQRNLQALYSGDARVSSRFVAVDPVMGGPEAINMRMQSTYDVQHDGAAHPELVEALKAERTPEAKSAEAANARPTGERFQTSTVVYSSESRIVESDWRFGMDRAISKVGFDPQLVVGADQVIVTGRSHNGASSQFSAQTLSAHNVAALQEAGSGVFTLPDTSDANSVDDVPKKMKPLSDSPLIPVVDVAKDDRTQVAREEIDNISPRLEARGLRASASATRLKTIGRAVASVEHGYVSGHVQERIDRPMRQVGNAAIHRAGIRSASAELDPERSFTFSPKSTFRPSKIPDVPVIRGIKPGFGTGVIEDLQEHAHKYARETADLSGKLAQALSNQGMVDLNDPQYASLPEADRNEAIRAKFAGALDNGQLEVTINTMSGDKFSQDFQKYEADRLKAIEAQGQSPDAPGVREGILLDWTNMGYVGQMDAIGKIDKRAADESARVKAENDYVDYELKHRGVEPGSPEHQAQGAQIREGLKGATGPQIEDRLEKMKLIDSRLEKEPAFTGEHAESLRSGAQDLMSQGVSPARAYTLVAGMVNEVETDRVKAATSGDPSDSLADRILESQKERVNELTHLASEDQGVKNTEEAIGTYSARQYNDLVGARRQHDAALPEGSKHLNVVGKLALGVDEGYFPGSQFMVELDQKISQTPKSEIPALGQRFSKIGDIAGCILKDNADDGTMKISESGVKQIFNQLKDMPQEDLDALHGSMKPRIDAWKELGDRAQDMSQSERLEEVQRLAARGPASAPVDAPVQGEVPVAPDAPAPAQESPAQSDPYAGVSPEEVAFIRGLQQWQEANPDKAITPEEHNAIYESAFGEPPVPPFAEEQTDADAMQTGASQSQGEGQQSALSDGQEVQNMEEVAQSADASGGVKV